VRGRKLKLPPCDIALLLIRINNSPRGDGFTIFYFLHNCKLPRPAGAKSWEFIVQAGLILAVTGGLAFKLKKIYNI